MFDPRTLPSGDMTFNLAVALLYVSMLADVFITRWGIWSYGESEGNKLMAWFTEKGHPFRTFLDAGIIRPLMIGAFLAVCNWGGFVDKAHAWLPFTLAGIAAIGPVKNYLKIRKLPKVK